MYLCRNWYTGNTENVVLKGACGFESLQVHQNLWDRDVTVLHDRLWPCQTEFDSQRSLHAALAQIVERFPEEEEDPGQYREAAPKFRISLREGYKTIAGPKGLEESRGNTEQDRC